MKSLRDRSRIYALALLCAGSLLCAGTAFATTMYQASVVAWHTSLMVSRDGRMVPVMTVNQGASLQVSDVTKNGWRQVIIRQTGNPAKWGWVAEGEVMVGNEIQVRNLPSSFSRSKSEPQSKSGASESHSHVDYPPGVLIAGVKLGYMLPLGAGGGLTFGGEAEYHLTDLPWGHLFVGALGKWATASAVPLGLTGNANFLTVQVGAEVHNLFGSDFYMGAFAGITVISVSSGGLSASTLQYSMAGLLGYDYRFSSLLSFGPEVGLDDIALGGYDSIQLLVIARIHF